MLVTTRPSCLLQRLRRCQVLNTPIPTGNVWQASAIVKLELLHAGLMLAGLESAMYSHLLLALQVGLPDSNNITLALSASSLI